MITLEVKSYCQNCPDFNPVVAKIYSDGSVLMQIVSCENSQRCLEICERVKQSYKNGEKI